MLSSNDRLAAEKGGFVIVGAELGAGGQGAVYQGSLDGGAPVAVKWYFPEFQTPELRESISLLITAGAPSPHFLWPDDVVTKGKGSGFGYHMRLRPPGYVKLTALLSRQVSMSFRHLLQAASHTVAAFKELQAKGLFYCDISDNNIFLNPRSGDVLICDNDNVGTSRTRNRVLGTARFMAPEVIRMEKRPSPLSDSYSMAVLLFLMLFNDHPLQGKNEAQIHCLDAAAMRQIYGLNPVFIFDPENASNRPVPGIHDNAPIFWALYPQEVRDVFTRIFTVGIRAPAQRPAFVEWQAAIAAAHDAIVACECGRQTFARPDPVQCWHCGRRVALPRRIVFGGRRTAMLNTDAALFDRHISARGGSVASPGRRRAEVARHPTSNVLGLRNTGPASWSVTMTGKGPFEVEPGKTLRIEAGTRIDFGDGEGLIHS